MKNIIVVSLSVAFAGCAQLDAKKQEQLITAFQEDMRAEAASCDAKFSDPAIDPIRTKVKAESVGEYSIVILGDKSKITESEKPAILAFDKAKTFCQLRMENTYYKYFGSRYAPIFDEIKPASKTYLTELYYGTITYGEYNTKSKNLADSIRPKIRAIDEQYRQQRMATEQQQAAGQQQLLNSLMYLNAVQQQRVDQMNYQIQQNRPIQTNCNSYGNQTNCTTWR